MKVNDTSLILCVNITCPGFLKLALSGHLACMLHLLHHVACMCICTYTVPRLPMGHGLAVKLHANVANEYLTPLASEIATRGDGIVMLMTDAKYLQCIG